MRFYCSRTAGFLQTVLVLALVNGCQAAPDAAQLAAARVPSAPAPSSQQLIIKFKRAAASCDQAGIARFSAAAGVPLELVRPMSGEACVVTQFGSNASGLARGLDALRKNSAVEWAEPDAVMKTQ